MFFPYQKLMQQSSWTLLLDCRKRVWKLSNISLPHRKHPLPSSNSSFAPLYCFLLQQFKKLLTPKTQEIPWNHRPLNLRRFSHLTVGVSPQSHTLNTQGMDAQQPFKAVEAISTALGQITEWPITMALSGWYSTTSSRNLAKIRAQIVYSYWTWKQERMTVTWTYS